MTPAERVLFVHAHPDDETITTGGTIATLVDRGAAVTLLTCTRGECGEIVPPDLQHLLGDAGATAQHREGELADAMRALGLTDHRFLGAADARIEGSAPRRYVDSGMVWGDLGPEPVADLPADALCAAELGEIAADIATVIAATGAQSVISYDENGGYGHPDHIMAHRAARRAAEVMGVPFFEIEAGDAPDGQAARTTRTRKVLDVTPVVDRKVAALRAHRSQLTVHGATIVLSGGQASPIQPTEPFHRRDAHRPTLRRFAEYDRWPRVVVCVAALITGALIGALTTVTHQVLLETGALSLPIGLVTGLIVVAALLIGLRVIFDTRIVAGLAALGLLGTISLLSMESAGGSVLVPESPLAYYWVIGPVVIAGLVLAWPSFTRPARDKIESSAEPKGPPSS